MIQRSDILSISFLKKSVFTGSFQGMRYRLEKVEADEAETDEAKAGKAEGAEGAESLRAIIWEGPYSYEVVAAEQKESLEFPFSEEGICEAVEWMNRKWQEQPDRWKRAQGNW